MIVFFSLISVYSSDDENFVGGYNMDIKRFNILHEQAKAILARFAMDMKTFRETTSLARWEWIMNAVDITEAEREILMSFNTIVDHGNNLINKN